MNNPKRISSTLVIGFAALGVSFALSAQAVDNRPIYYVMLKSLEDAFQAYNTTLAAHLKTHASRLTAEYETERLAISKESEMLDVTRSRNETLLHSERELLNKRIAAVNERIALRDKRSNGERRIQQHHSPRYANDPRIKALRERIAAGLAEIDAVRSSYLRQATAMQRARATLTGQIEEYMNARDPLALEIRTLGEEWHRFAESERRKLKQAADAYAVDYAAYDKWLDAERATLEGLGAALQSAHETDREQRALHAETDTALQALIAEYNALVVVHNTAGVDDPQRDDRAMKFARLEDQIADLQAILSQARDAVVNVNEEIAQRNRELTQHHERFVGEKRVRDISLAADLADINAARLTAETAIDERRQNVDKQIKSLEAHISGELRDARTNLEKLNTGLVEAFGRDHAGFDAAITRELEMNDDRLLYTATGAPRFDLSRPMTASVYTAVERLEADRREIDARIAAIEQNQGGSQQSAAGAATAAGTLERELASASAERQRLLEAYAASARNIQAQSAALEERRRVIDARFADERASLGELYSARASLTRSEMQAVQQVLVSAVRAASDTATRGGDHADLLKALHEKARRMHTPVDESLLAPHALMDGIASHTAGREAGLHTDPWAAFSPKQIAASKKLTGSDKVALASTWLERLRRQSQYAEITNALNTSGAVKDGGAALSRLFMAGVVDHTTITEQRLDDGGIGIQVSVLGRDYQLDAGGSLEHLPE